MAAMGIGVWVPFENKNIIITGGTSGIGLSLACLLASHRANLLLLARSAEQSDSAAEKVRKSKRSESQILILKNLDVSKRTVDPELERQILSFNVDVLVNNAGVVVPKVFSALSTDEIFQQIDTNLLGAMLVTKMCLPVFR